ncbi:MAG: hypothetical protein R3285_08870 [Kiloniellales bacterium]|nr:hypothetical protein [Kiloniellales bacterium]
MRQFSAIIIVIYLVLGVGTGVAYYAKGETYAGPETGGGQLPLEASMVAVAWPFHIQDVLTEHDPR